MDTDDLLEEAYSAVIINAEKFHHDLTLQFGVMASDCKDESEYLKEALLLIKEFESDIEEAIDEIFYENIPEKSKFKSALKEIKKSIKDVQKIPIDKRKYIEL
ncbi:MAG: hypothetical protein Q8N03_11465 [Ignavibacteria bacterium]|nr:hypothetical protein [Ignavibacteria bacterium]MDP3831108.1 hypothetical protein [Ignavibacteriaceae bacterium]